MAQGGNINLGRVKIIPNFMVQGTYDDNIYKGSGEISLRPEATPVEREREEREEREESDWITHVMPGVLLNYTLPERGYLNLGYQGDFTFYEDNDNNNWKSHKANLDFSYQAPVGLIVVLSNLYARTEDSFGSAEQYRIGKVTKRWTNDLKGKVGSNFTNNFRAFAYYNLCKQDYELIEDAAQDYIDNEFGIGAEVKFLPRTWGFVRYHYGERDYNTYTDRNPEERDADSKWHRVNAGLTWDVGAKLQGELNFGYQCKEYDNQFSLDGSRRKDEDGWIAATSISYQPTATTNLVFNLTRTVRDTSSDNNEYFKDTAIGINVQQIIRRRFVANLGFMYSNNDYNVAPKYPEYVAIPTTESRKDDNYLANVGINYNIRNWLTAGLAYSYNEKDSNYSKEDFTDHQFMVTIKVMY